MKKELSEAAQWFLLEFRRILEDFAKETESQIALLDKEGNLIIEFTPNQKICQLIWGVEEGKIRCFDHFKIALEIVKGEKKLFLTECYAGFVSIWLPIIIGNSVLGIIINCGGKMERGENEIKLKEKFLKLSSELEIFDKEKFTEIALQTTKVNKEILEKRIGRLEKLIAILKESTLTPLKEVFG